MHMRLLFGAVILPLSVSLAAGEAWAQDVPSPELPDEDRQISVPGPPADVTLPRVEPIFDEGEFESSIPDISVEDDPELDRPFETIEQFERRLASEQADANPEQGAAPPLGVAALDDGDRVEEIGDAPVRDTELIAPLPPIEDFELASVEFAEAETEGEAVELAYKVEVTGLDAADAETDKDLQATFNGLSALKAGDGKAANAAMIAARLSEDAQLVQAILSSDGWYTAQIKTRVERPEESGDQTIAAVIEVTPGTRYSLSEIVIEAAPTEPPDLIRKNLALKVGNPIIAERIQGAEAQVAIALPENGYPFTKIGDRDLLLDRDTGEGVYTLPVEIGPRSRFGSFAASGNPVFAEDHIELLARFERGELYDSRKVDDLRKALVATGLFATIAVEPQQSGETAEDGTELVTMVVDQQPGKPRTIAGGAGFSTGEGIRLEATWTHRNMFPPEGALIANLVAGTLEQGAGVTFRRANAGRRDRTFELAAEALRSNFDAFEALTGRLAARMSYDSTPIWQKRITYAVGLELLGTAEKEFNFDLGRRARRTFYVGALTGQVGLDFSNSLLDPTRGFRVTAVVQPEGSFQGEFTPYVRARLDTSGYFPVGDSMVLAARVRVGTIQGAERFKIAPSRRFYSGGGGSVRGYAYQKLGPLDPNGDPIGGRSLNEAAFEVRYRFGDFGVVGFVDAGQSYESTTPKFSDLRFGAGVGMRYYTNFGPLRIDIATPVGRRTGESRFNLYVSIGQSF